MELCGGSCTFTKVFFPKRNNESLGPRRDEPTFSSHSARQPPGSAREGHGRHSGAATTSSGPLDDGTSLWQVRTLKIWVHLPCPVRTG